MMILVKEDEDSSVAFRRFADHVNSLARIG